MNQTERADAWDGVREWLIRSSRTLAYGKEPWVIFASGRDDVDYARKPNPIEHLFARETDEFIRQFIRTREFPEGTRNVVRFYAGQRFDWAANFVRILRTTTQEGKVAFPPPNLGATEFLEWLLIIAYHSRLQPPLGKSGLAAPSDHSLNTLWS